MTCGIYMIINNKTGQKYIGQSINIEKRWNEHKNLLKNNKHYNAHLQNAWNKYKKNNFSFLIIEKCHKNALDSREQYWINYHNTYQNKKHYNLTLGGDYKSKSQKKSSKNNVNLSKVQNTSGYFRVHKHKRDVYKQGFIWRYKYCENGKRKEIESVDLKKLEEKVKAKGLEWKKYE